MISSLRSCGFRVKPVVIVLAVAMGSMTGSSAFAQGGDPNANRGFYPYYGGRYDRSLPTYNIYGNYGVYGYPGSGVEGGQSNSGYDRGYGGYPSYGGYGVINKFPDATPQKRLLGIDEDPVVTASGAKAMKIGKVYPGTAAERAGLQAGDVILSVNGFLTEQRGNLAWIIANTKGSNELKLTVQTVKDGQTHVVTAMLR
jgi:membrane-associated protease RseP (regulator of RpoE activity)